MLIKNFQVGDRVWFVTIEEGFDHKEEMNFTYSIEEGTINGIKCDGNRQRFSIYFKDTDNETMVSWLIEEEEWNIKCERFFDRKEEAIAWLGEKFQDIRLHKQMEMEHELKLMKNNKFKLVNYMTNEEYHSSNDYGRKNLDNREFTKLYDANHRKIYVGDIIKTLEGDILKVCSEKENEAYVCYSLYSKDTFAIGEDINSVDDRLVCYKADEEVFCIANSSVDEIRIEKNIEDDQNNSFGVW